MRKTLRITGALLAALATLAGCRHTEQELVDTSSVKTVRFRAATAETRTAFAALENGEYRTEWTGNDEAVLLSLNYAEAKPSAITLSDDGATASFEASFDAAAATSPYTFYAVSPASAARAISPSRKAWSVYIAAEQTPLATSVDEAAQLLVAKSGAASTLPDEVDLHFGHLTAYGRITLKNLELGDAVVSKADLVFSTPVVGEWYWGEDGTLTSNGASHTITLHTDATGDLWFACAPVDVSGETLTLTLFTDQGCLTKRITFPEGRSFAAGKVARFSVDMDGIGLQGSETFLLVEDVSVLQAGDELLIVNADGTFALGGQTGSGTPYRKQVSVTAENGRIADQGDATVLTLGAGAVDGTWSFHTGTGYLASKSSGNALTEQSGKNKYSSWTVSISAGVTTVKASAGSSTFIKYNTAAPRFSCYRATVTNLEEVVLYRKGTGPSGPVSEDPLASESEYGSYLPEVAWTYAKGADQISRTRTADGKVEFALLNAGKKEQLVVSGYDPTLAKGASAQVSVRYKKGIKTLLEKDYTLKVVREDGAKVWLGNGSGQGLIIKK